MCTLSVVLKNFAVSQITSSDKTCKMRLNHVLFEANYAETKQKQAQLCFFFKTISHDSSPLKTFLSFTHPQPKSTAFSHTRLLHALKRHYFLSQTNTQCIHQFTHCIERYLNDINYFSSISFHSFTLQNYLFKIERNAAHHSEAGQFV